MPSLPNPPNLLGLLSRLDLRSRKHHLNELVATHDTMTLIRTPKNGEVYGEDFEIWVGN
jgi:hypothetical protein